MIPLRYLQPLAVALLVASLCGCVTSALPLFDDKAGLSDSKFVGRFKMQYRGEDYVKGQQPGELIPDLVPETFDVLQRGNQYLVVENRKLMYLASLYSFGKADAIAQLWRTGTKSNEFIYILVRPTSHGLRLRALDCDPPDPGTEGCHAKTKEEVSRLAEYTSLNFDKNPNKIFFAEKQD